MAKGKTTKAGSGRGPGIPAGYLPQDSAARVPLQGNLPNFSPARGSTDWSGINTAIERINRHYAVTRMGGKTVVLEESTDAEGQDQVSFMDAQAFMLWHLGEQYVYDGELVDIGKLWLRSAQRRSFRGVVFAPVNKDGSGAPPDGFYNLWRGYSVVPAKRVNAKGPGSITLFLDHIRTNIAGGDKDLAQWIVGWFAHMIQRPAERFGTALVLRGDEGTGKSKIGEIIGALIGSHYVMVDQPDHITGKHNAHMKSLLLLQVDEGFWAGDKQAEGKLKSLVTSRQQMIEPKNVDAVFMRNYVRLFISSNEDWVVPVSMKARRWAVFDVGSAAQTKHEYFAAIDAEMDNGGREALLRYLLDFDLASVNLRVVPKTRALFEQKLASLKPEQSFWYEALVRGTQLPDRDEWESAVSVGQLYRAYIAFAEAQGYRHKVSPSSFGQRLGKLVPGLRIFRPQASARRPDPMEEDGRGPLPSDEQSSEGSMRPRMYAFPSLEDCRAAFADAVQQDVTWG